MSVLFRPIRSFVLLALLLPGLGLTTAEPPPAAIFPPPTVEDALRVRISPGVMSSVADRLSGPSGLISPVSPRLLVLFCEREGPLGDRDPIDAPFYRRPQPIRSVAIDLREILSDGGLKSIPLGDGIDGVARVPDRIEDLQGPFKVRAVLDFGLERGHDVPGNAVSAVVEVDLMPGRMDEIELTIDEILKPEPLPRRDNLVWIELDSPILSAALGRPVKHRAGVALPPSYADPNAERRFWPAVYVIPGFGGDERDALGWAGLQADRTLAASMPPAAFIVLDPEDPLGHHGFVDGDNMGPRATALVEEFIPWLEKRFRLIDEPAGRMLQGHSSGAWSSIWLQIQHPEVFGACFASAPDPVDFSAFGTVDLLVDDSLHEDSDGQPRPSYRSPLSADLDQIHMTVAEETAMENALAPDGTSGEQWSAWNAMFSGRDPRTGLPRVGYDLSSGCIDRAVVDEDWRRFDIAESLRRDPKGVGRILRNRVRILCGSRDCYYLEEAVRRLDLALAEIADTHDLPEGPGWIEIIEGATHDTILGPAMRQWLPEMTEFARSAPGG